MDEIILYKSKWKAIRLMLIALPFLAFSVYDLLQSNHINADWLNYLSIVLFGSGFIYGFYNLFDRRALLIINETGVWVRTEYPDFINWDAIDHAYWKTIRRQKFVCLIIKDDFKPLIKPENKLKAMAIALRGYDIMINLNTMRNIDQQKLTALIINLANAEPMQRHDLLTTKIISQSI
ncbi:STM3941 family protein [Mucilaginibacter sp. KACC 22063]|uniref:STM3941 family protein n=1 Tax=Mucilaginibacter sp. KACC 22063 TaxID=3025666 RepID=UPI002365D2B4|nr:STM3941 family protein [Mucilaginibacter sp. KACC 22063]WDF53375.1 hypothetical protein PQ461_10495 [Mucilaginibacter sp. KACC 22063]